MLSQNFENSLCRGIIITIIEGSSAWHYKNIIPVVLGVVGSISGGVNLFIKKIFNIVLVFNSFFY